MPPPQSILTAPPTSADAPNVLTVQQQMNLAQKRLHSLQHGMEALIQKQVTSPDPNCGQKLQALQQDILQAQLEFQSLLAQSGKEGRPPLRSEVPSTTGAPSAPGALLSTLLVPDPHVRSIVPPSSCRSPTTGEGPSLGVPSMVISPPLQKAMRFEKEPLPPGPLDMKREKSKQKKKSKSTKPQTIEDIFSKMGSPRVPPQWLYTGNSPTRSASPPSPSVSTKPTTPGPAGKSNSVKPANAQRIEDVFRKTGSPKAPPKALDTDNPLRSTPQATVNNATNPVLLDAFPSLPPFEPTDMAWADVNVTPEDLTYPEELQKLLQEEEPLVDKRGGRPSSQTLAIVDKELADMDIKLNELSKSAGISITNILKRWNTTKTRGASLWNTYQQYFTAYKAEELGRLNLDPTTQATGLIRSQAYVAFRKAYPDTWPQVLGVWAQCAELENGNKSVQQRALAFRRTWRTICDIVSPFLATVEGL
jgi:hypothetical protein